MLSARSLCAWHVRDWAQAYCHREDFALVERGVGADGEGVGRGDEGAAAQVVPHRHAPRRCRRGLQARRHGEGRWDGRLHLREGPDAARAAGAFRRDVPVQARGVLRRLRHPDTGGVREVLQLWSHAARPGALRRYVQQDVRGKTDRTIGIELSVFSETPSRPWELDTGGIDFVMKGIEMQGILSLSTDFEDPTGLSGQPHPPAQFF